jgi:hypothetical protein
VSTVVFAAVFLGHLFSDPCLRKSEGHLRFYFKSQISNFASHASNCKFRPRLVMTLANPRANATIASLPSLRRFMK